MNKNILSIYALFTYAFLNIIVGLWTISFADTTVIADMQEYDAVVCGVGTIFIVWGMLIIGTIVSQR